MKKLILLGLLAFGVSTSALAQSRFGVKAGVNLTRYAGNKFSGSTSGFDFDPFVGFHAGVTYAIPVAADGFFSIRPELLYSQKGSKVTEQGVRTTSRLHYLDLPVLARINAGGFVVEAGPQLGYLLHHTGSFTGGAQTVGYENFDFGYVAGVGYQSEQGYNLGVRYNGGLSDIFSEVIGGVINPRNSGFQLYVGYSFIGK